MSSSQGVVYMAATIAPAANIAAAIPKMRSIAKAAKPMPNSLLPMAKAWRRCLELSLLSELTVSRINAQNFPLKAQVPMTTATIPTPNATQAAVLGVIIARASFWEIPDFT